MAGGSFVFLMGLYSIEEKGDEEIIEKVGQGD